MVFGEVCLSEFVHGLPGDHPPFHSGHDDILRSHEKSTLAIAFEYHLGINDKAFAMFWRVMGTISAVRKASGRGLCGWH